MTETQNYSEVTAETEVPAVPPSHSETGTFTFLFLTAAVLICAVPCLRRVFLKRKRAEQLYELQRELLELKGLDDCAALFMRNARAYQALIGIERDYKEDAVFVRRLQTEFLSLVSMKDDDAGSFQIPVTVGEMPDRKSFLREKRLLSSKNLEKEILKTSVGIRERKNRRCFRQALLQTGLLLCRIADGCRKMPDDAGALRGEIRKIKEGLCCAGIFPLFLEDFKGNPGREKEFETGSPYATSYPGLYEMGKDGELLLIQGCWGVRRERKV